MGGNTFLEVTEMTVGDRTVAVTAMTFLNSLLPPISTSHCKMKLDECSSPELGKAKWDQLRELPAVRQGSKRLPGRLLGSHRLPQQNKTLFGQRMEARQFRGDVCRVLREM